jgi:hypothetical protein
MLLSAKSVLSAERTDGLEFWFSAGYQDSEVSFEESLAGSWRSVLEFEADGFHVVGLGTRYQFVNAGAWSPLSFSFEGLMARSLEGDVKDTDYLMTSSSPWVYSESDGDCEHNQWDMNLGWEMINMRDRMLKVDLLFGYLYSKYDFEVRNTNTSIFNYSATSSTVVGLTAEYEARMKGSYLGVGAEAHLANDKVRLKACLKYLPRLRGEGEGTWTYRALRFLQDGDGNGYELTLGVSVIPKDNWSIGANLVMQELEVDGHVENYGLSYEEDLYGNSTEFIERTWSSMNDLDSIQFDSTRLDVKVGYVF